METIYDMKTGDEVMETIYDTDTEDMKTIYDLVRNAVTSIVSVTASAWASTQGDASTGYQVAGTVLLFIFLKWLTLDTWDYIGQLVRERKQEHD